MRGDLPLIGRWDEVEAIRSEARAGTGTVVVGAAGIGKSALAAYGLSRKNETIVSLLSATADGVRFGASVLVPHPCHTRATLRVTRRHEPI